MASPTRSDRRVISGPSCPTGPADGSICRAHGPRLGVTPLSQLEVRGARVHNLKNVDVSIPRDALVVFTGVSGSGKSSLAFGTIYAEAQRRFLESVSPYARRLFDQMEVPDVDDIFGLPPAIALQQQRGAPSTRSSVGSVTTLSNLLRMLYSRAGTYPPKQPMLHAAAFSPNTPEGACPKCHGLGRTYDATEASMVPDPSLTIRERAIAAWPTAWQGQNLRDILTTLDFDVDVPWRSLPKKDRRWILFTDERPTVPVYAGFDRQEVKRALHRKAPPSYQGTFTSARRHVVETFASSDSARMKQRAAKYLVAADCPECKGKRLRRDALAVRFGGLDIAEIGLLPMRALRDLVAPFAKSAGASELVAGISEERVVATQRIVADVVARLDVVLDLGLGYLSLDRATPTLSPGELQRLRLATQLRSQLFGVAFVLDEPTAGLHPTDTEALLRALDGLRRAGNSVFVVEHELEVIRRADWIVEVGPDAGARGGEVLYSGPPDGLRDVPQSRTRPYLFEDDEDLTPRTPRTPRTPEDWLRLRGVTRNNLRALDADFPLGIFTTVTGVSGSGKSTLVSQALVGLIEAHLGGAEDHAEAFELETLERSPEARLVGRIAHGAERVRRLVRVDQRAIGRTPRSNLATYTGLFDHVRRLFAATKLARARKYDAGHFSFNVAKGRCARCEGEGSVEVELLFLPSVYAPCPVCRGRRYEARILDVKFDGQSIADVLAMTVDRARALFRDEPSIGRALDTLIDVGVGYLRLGQPATELSGGEAQRIKLATELQRLERRGTLYVLDEPTTGLHPLDVDRLMVQLHGLVDGGATVIVVEHDLRVIAGSDWVIDLGPGAGDEGGRIVAVGTPEEMLSAFRARWSR